MSSASATRQLAEHAAQVTTPVPVGISGVVFLGITVKDWVLMGTALLLVFQLIVIAPKACRVLRSAYTKTKGAVTNGKSQ